jgi:hypothetical protein
MDSLLATAMDDLKRVTAERDQLRSHRDDLQRAFNRVSLERDVLKAALTEFVDAVDSTGGLTDDSAADGVGPAADPRWTDLAAVYVGACDALGKTPLMDDVLTVAPEAYLAMVRAAAGVCDACRSNGPQADCEHARARRGE